MNELVHIFKIIGSIFGGIAFIYFLYNVIFSLFGIYKKKSISG